MARLTNAQLQERVAALESELAKQRMRADHLEDLSKIREGAPGSRGRRSIGWAIVSATLIVIGSLLAPAAIVASWAGTTLTNTDRFVQTYSGILADEAVQDFLVSEVTSAIDGAADLDAIIDKAFSAAASATGLPPQTSRVLGLLQSSVADAVKSLIATTVRSVIVSQAFQKTWESTLRVAHSQLVATMNANPDALLQISDRGTLELPLGPIVAAARDRLEAQGVGIARLIPEVNRSVVIVESDALPALRLAYSAIVSTAIWLPIATLLILAAGVLLARRRLVALLGAGLGLGISMIATAIVIGMVGAAVAVMVPVSLIPEPVSRVIYWTAATPLRNLALLIALLALLIALAAWITGPSTPARRLRSWFMAPLAKKREAADISGTAELPEAEKTEAAEASGAAAIS